MYSDFKLLNNILEIRTLPPKNIILCFILNFSQNLEHMLLQVGVLTIPFNIFDVYYATQNNCKIKSNTDDECLYQKMPYIWKYIWN